MNPAETAVLINFANDLFYYELGSDKAVARNQQSGGRSWRNVQSRRTHDRLCSQRTICTSTTSPPRRERRLTTDGGPKILNGRLDWVYQEELYGRGNFEAYWWSPDSTMLAYLRLDENPGARVHRRRSHSLSTRMSKITPYPKAGDPNPMVKLGVVNAAGGGTRWVDTYKYQPAIS